MTSEMQPLADVLEKWTCLEKFKFIQTAAVPVIKLEINLEKLRSEEPELKNFEPLADEVKIL